MFDKEVYISRRQKLVSLMAVSAPEGKRGIALFIGNVDAPAQYKSNGYKFRQDSTWLYYFGLDEPRFAAILDLDDGTGTLYSDDYEIDDIIWTGPMPSVASLAGRTGLSASAPYAALDEAVQAAKAQGRPVHFIPPSRYYNTLKLKELGLTAPSEALIRAIVSMRLVKEEREIALIDAACDLGQQMHAIARDAIGVGVVEQDIVGKMEGFALAKGWGVSFPTILTQHGEIFHNHSHDCTIEPGRLLVIDAGVESNDSYASDFTRTYPTGGRFTAQQRDIYTLVYQCNEVAFGMIRPGVAYRDVHLSVARRMLEGLKDLGLVRGDVDEMVAAGVAGLFMPHGLGHNMGLDVHDMEDLGEDLVGYDGDQKRSPQLGLGSLRMARRLRPGNVITDEPGIYFIPALIEKWKGEGTNAAWVDFSKLEAYYNFGGIRLEDDVLVTADGARRLGPNRLPIAPDDVEAVMNR
ncbi:MAG: aminopeptidase P family protein [Bacteroidales bacterium]|nr:aminopeptidase P family protein [Bacteroidales bacterium]